MKERQLIMKNALPRIWTCSFYLFISIQTFIIQWCYTYVGYSSPDPTKYEKKKSRRKGLILWKYHDPGFKLTPFICKKLIFEYSLFKCAIPRCSSPNHTEHEKKKRRSGRRGSILWKWIICPSLWWVITGPNPSYLQTEKKTPSQSYQETE